MQTGCIACSRTRPGAGDAAGLHLGTHSGTQCARSQSGEAGDGRGRGVTRGPEQPGQGIPRAEEHGGAEVVRQECDLHVRRQRGACRRASRMRPVCAGSSRRGAAGMGQQRMHRAQAHLQWSWGAFSGPIRNMAGAVSKAHGRCFVGKHRWRPAAPGRPARAAGRRTQLLVPWKLHSAQDAHACAQPSLHTW